MSPVDRIPVHDSGEATMKDRVKAVGFWVVVAVEVVMLGCLFLWMAMQQVGY